MAQGTRSLCSWLCHRDGADGKRWAGGHGRTLCQGGQAQKLPKASLHPLGGTHSPQVTLSPFGRGTCHSCCAPSMRSLCQGHPQLWWLCRMKELSLSCIPGCPCGSLQALLGCSSVPQPRCRIQPSPEAVSLNIKSSSCWQCWGVGKDSRSNLQLKCVYLRKEVPETCN